jgi:hypothetical protein
VENKSESTIQGYHRWLKNFDWAWYATLKVTSGAPSITRAEKLFDRWVLELRAKEGGSDFRWVRVMELGRFGANPHFHALIGGLRNRTKYWESRWNELGGDALISRFDPERQGIFYMLKDTNESGDLNIDFDLSQSGGVAGSSPVKAPGDQTAAQGLTKLRIDEIDEKTRPQDLRKLFSESGRVLEAGVVETSITPDRKLTYGFVVMADDDAEYALDDLDQQELFGRLIRISRMRS